MRRISLIMILFFVCGMCTTASDSTSKNAEVYQSREAILYGINTSADQLEVKVLSFGCTKTSHFELDYNHIKLGIANISVIRLKQDQCRSNPFVKTIQFQIDPAIRERVSQLVITNTFRTDTFNKGAYETQYSGI
ncbi:hypothetical protein [Aliikangiella coralliicola]|uniref:Uncharacterized protein n=1 Tax=Aliikangiella coralliicola TaxID=2592383 RepID=A0A545UIH5_9GAMM|nr:hypothetical protein [Aliikangiella coralliicola]TQV89271.1 hypothetical protein FLL46_03835 [Aliikangiella coralliicola]